MMRILLRFLGLSSFAISVLMLVIDLIASAGKDATVLRPFGAQWLSLHEDSLNALHDSLTASGPSALWDDVLMPILSQPGEVVFGCLALLFLALALLFPRRRGRERLGDDPRYD